MKKRTVVIITVIVCVIALIVVGFIAAFSWLGHVTKDIIDGTEEVQVSDRLMVGTDNISVDDIENVRIEWVSGNITVKYYDGDTIAVSESSVDEKYQMQCYKENGTFVVCEFKNDITHMKVKKNLEVLLPAEFEMKNFTVETVSGRVNCLDISADEVLFDTVSANLNVELAKSPKKIGVNSVSGNVICSLPENIPGFTVDHDSISGHVVTKDFNGQRNYGDESTEITFESVSGNLKLQKLTSEKE